MKNLMDLFQKQIVLLGFLVMLSSLLSVLTYFFNLGIQDFHLFFIMLAFTLAFALVALKVEVVIEDQRIVRKMSLSRKIKIKKTIKAVIIILLSGVLFALVYLGIIKLSFFNAVLEPTLAFKANVLKAYVAFSLFIIGFYLLKKDSITRYEEKLNDEYYALYLKLKILVNSTRLSKQEKRQSLLDVISLLIDAQSSNKEPSEIIMYPEQFIQELVDAYGEKNYGINEVINSLIRLILTILGINTMDYFFQYPSIGFFEIPLDVLYLLILYLVFFTPMWRYLKHTQVGLNVKLLSYIPVILFFLGTITYQIFTNFSPDFVGNSEIWSSRYSDLKLIPNIGILYFYLFVLLTLLTLRFFLRSPRKLQYSENQDQILDFISSNRKIRIGFWTSICLYGIALIVLPLSCIHNWEKDIINRSETDLDISFVSRFYADNHNSMFFPHSGLPKYNEIAWKLESADNTLADDTLLYDGEKLYVTSFYRTHQMNTKKPEIFSRSPLTLDKDSIITVDLVYKKAGIERFEAYQKESGILLWRYNFKKALTDYHLLDNGKIYATSKDGYVYALDALTGKLIWSFNTEGMLNSNPTVHNNTIYIVNKNGLFFALNGADGNLIWKQNISEWNHADDVFAVRESTVVYYDQALFLFDKWKIVKICAQTGKIFWKYQAEDYFIKSVAVAYQKLFINFSAGSNEKSRTVAFNPDNLEEIWSFTPSNGDKFLGRYLGIANHVAYTWYSDGMLYALNVENGSIIWSFDAQLSDNYKYSLDFDAIAIGNGAIYIGNVEGKYLCALK
jgi:outer membrane protein assembly factor BamB